MSETTLIFDGKHTTNKNGDEWGMVYGIAIPTLTPGPLVSVCAE